MKAFTKLLFVAFVAIIGLVSCDKQIVLPTIEIKSVGSTENSIVFTISAKDASQIAYMCNTEGFDNISADKIMRDGVVVKNVGNTVIVSGLQSSTKYSVAAAAKNELGAVMSNIISITTKQGNGNGGSDDNSGDGGNDDGSGSGDNGGNNGNEPEYPDTGDVVDIVIEKTTGGRWYREYNYYVYFVRDNGDRIQLDFYTLSETNSQYLPYGTYLLGDNYAPYTIHPESSCYLPAGWPKDENGNDTFGYMFTDVYVNVDIKGGYYSVYMMLTYDENGVERTIQGYYNGILSNASVPAGDDAGSDKLIEVLEVGSNSFKFRINAADDQYWRCSVVDKRVYDQYNSNPGAWVVTYGMMLNGTLTFDWVDGEYCEYVPAWNMTVTSSTDYLIFAALMDYSEGQENALLGGVEVVQIRTKAETAGAASVDVAMKQINTYDVVFDCIFGDNVWSCYAAMLETANVDEVKAGKYVEFGYTNYEECMISLIPGLTPEFKRQFMASQYDYKWDNLKYGTSYTLCIKVIDNNGGATYQEFGPFVTNRPE